MNHPILRGALCAAALVCASAAPAAAAETRPIKVQMLGLNDFHGALSPSAGGTLTVPAGTPGSTNDRLPAGGAAYLKTHLDGLRAKNFRTLVVGAGDLIGASPLNSALFRDEPTIKALDEMGLTASAVGNHEFDDGYRELLRVQHGGCHADDVCDPDDPAAFDGAAFRYLGANVRKKDGTRALPGYVIKSMSGVKVALIGAVLRSTPTIVNPNGIANLEFRDEAQAINEAVQEIKAKGGADLYTVLIHQGGVAGGFYNDCTNFTQGDLVPILKNMTQDVEVVFTGHTHAAYNCRLGGRTVISGASNGRVISQVVAQFDRETRDLFSVSSKNIAATQDVAEDPEVKQIVDDATTKAAPLANRVVGSAGEDLLRATTAAGESVLGDLIADSQLAAGASEGAVIAFMNPGGIRGDLLTSASPGGEAQGQITYGELFTIQPFGNILQAITLKGSQLDAVLEQQFDNPSAGQNRILQVSKGFAYTWDAAAPKGSKVSAITLNGTPIDPDASYRVVVNTFIQGGGDGFTALKEGTNAVGVGQDIDAFEAYVTANSPVAATPRDRITRVG